MPNRKVSRRQELLNLGATPGELASSSYQRLFHDAYVVAGHVITVTDRARAALRFAVDGSYASHHTAAAIWGAPVPADSETHISVPGEAGRSRRRGIRSHRARGGPPVRRGGVPVSTPEQTFLDLAAVRIDLIDLVAVGDALVAAGHTTCAALMAAAAADSDRGCRLARRAAGFVRAGVDSATESRLRMLIVLAGLPEPVVDHRLRRPDGSVEYRLDLSYPELKLVIEYDGRQHAESPAQWRRDLRRREELERRGWRFVVIIATDLFGEPWQTLQRIRTALHERGVRVPPRPKNAWFHHFGPAPI